MKVTFSTEIKSHNLYSEQRINNLYGKFLNRKITLNSPDSFSVKNDAIKLALSELEKMEFSKEDVKKIERYGAKLIFKNGKEAVDFAKSNNIPIVFDKVDRPDIHAQWVNTTKTIIINDKYKNTQDKAVILGISAAILHELSHAKDNDSISSVQEEIDCLGMNALAFNVLRKQNPNIFKNSTAPIIQDGVNLYADLFMGNNKKALAERIKDKYGDLILESPNHSAGKFAIEIKNNN